MLRWSHDWELRSLARLQEKWNLAEDGYFKQKYKALGWRRRDTILKPILNKMGLTDRRSLPHKLLMYGLLAPTETMINRIMTRRYARRHLQAPLERPVAVLADSPSEQVAALCR